MQIQLPKSIILPGKLIFALVFLFNTPIQSATAFSRIDVQNGFYKAVMGVEITRSGNAEKRVKKYLKPVRVFIINHAKKPRSKAVGQFIRKLDNTVFGLDITLAPRARSANFIVHVVDRNQFLPLVRRKVFNNQKIRINGNCLVHVLSDRRGISKSEAFIVSDRGEAFFKRCLHEEIMQGLGPLNDDASLKYSVFNDRSRLTEYTRFDKFLLNILYHQKIKTHMDRKAVDKVLNEVISDVSRRLSNRLN